MIFPIFNLRKQGYYNKQFGSVMRDKTISMASYGMASLVHIRIVFRINDSL